ncbi:MAG: hypothetical protein GEV12_06195 [Micromonosporaceae bacterium]|nr:hypothetical protein [Micromonosporaceae bacterium]
MSVCTEPHLVQDGHPGWVPFTGSQDLPLVDVGTGSVDELAGLDLAGKLALLEADGTFDNPFGAAACGVDIVMIQNVRDAGAAGLVVFPSPDHVCAPLPIPLRIVQEQFTGPAKEVGIPNVHVSTQEGLDLRAQLAAEPVTVRVDGTPETPYSYVLKPYEEGHVPDSLHYTLTDAQLAAVELDFHAPRPTTFRQHRSVWKPDDLVKAALRLSDHGAPAFVGPRSHTEYFGPVSREVLHTRSGLGRQGGLAPEGYRNRMQRASFPEIFDQPAQARQQWYLPPKTPGARSAPEAVYDLVGPDALQSLGMCTLCRQSGILLTHLPLVTGGPGSWQHDLGAGSSASLAEEGFFDLEFRLFRDGAEIAPVPGLPWAVFPMPAAPGSYRMTAQGPQTEVTWTFTSSEPVEDTRRPGHTCFMELISGSTDPCSPEPIVFASYDLAGSLELDNTVLAPGAQRFSVHAYHSPSTAPMPEIAGLELSVSYDGEQWSPARVRPAGDGRFEVTLVHPPARARASDQVSLRVEAWDEAGNRIEQITRDAFILTDRVPGGAL